VSSYVLLITAIFGGVGEDDNREARDREVGPEPNIRTSYVGGGVEKREV
jgi:hypothetical protein